MARKPAVFRHPETGEPLATVRREVVVPEAVHAELTARATRKGTTYSQELRRALLRGMRPWKLPTP